MDSILRLNLQVEKKPAEVENLSKAEGENPEPLVDEKKLNEIANKAAHRAARDQHAFERGHSSIFSK
jgi:hypothetical protein